MRAYENLNRRYNDNDDFITKVILLIVILFFTLDIQIVKGEEIGLASWYSVESSGTITANGEHFQESALTCASNDYPFNSILKITNIENSKYILCRVNDRGGFKKYNRIIDLSKGSFAKIADLKKGVITVQIERIK